MIPFTLDGSEIALDAPRSEGMTDVQATAVSDAAEELREVVLHCHYDLSGRDLIVYAANVPGETVAFTFGDGTADVSAPVDGGQAQATHSYATDGVYTVGVITDTDRWHTEVAVNWPTPPEQEAPA